MELKIAKLYYIDQVLIGFHAVRDPENQGWLLCIEGTNDKSWTLQTALGKPKTYSTVESLLADVDRIRGVGQVESLRIGL